jgi:bifunctional non-homologous end joining protein LigD
VWRGSATSRHVTPKPPTADLDTPTVAGVRISHPDRLIYPDLGISKIQLAHYYEEIADWIVPHVAGRPLTLVHCPNGLAAACIYLKHAKAWGPSALRRVKILEKTKVGEYLVADSIEAVVSLAQMGIVEIHTWNSTIEDIDRPNRIVWDLDPGPAVTWKQVVKAAGLLRAVLKTLGLTSWVKTTGGRDCMSSPPSSLRARWENALNSRVASATRSPRLIRSSTPQRLRNSDVSARF